MKLDKRIFKILLFSFLLYTYGQLIRIGPAYMVEWFYLTAKHDLVDGIVFLPIVFTLQLYIITFVEMLLLGLLPNYRHISKWVIIFYVFSNCLQSLYQCWWDFIRSGGIIE